MRKMKLLIALTTGFMMLATLNSYAGTWEQNGLDWKYKNDNGSYATGWILDKDYYYYFDANGIMLSDCKTPDGYFVAFNGKLIWNVKMDVIDSIIDVGGDLINEAKAAGYSITPDYSLIAVSESKANYNQDDIILTRSGNEYTFDIRINLKVDFNRKALQQLARLTSIDGLGNLLLNDNDNEVYPLDQWVDMGNGHQILVHEESKSLIYKIK